MKNISIISLMISFLFLHSCKTKESSDMNVKPFGYVNDAFIYDYQDSVNKVRNDKIFETTDTFQYRPYGYYLAADSVTIRMNDTSIIRKARYDVNGEFVCCKMDTVLYFIERMEGINFLFVANGPGIYLAEIEKDAKIKFHNRPKIKVPLWGTDYSSLLEENDFKDSLSVVKSLITGEILYTENYSIYLKNRDIKLTSIKLVNENKRIISQVKKDISQNDLDQFLLFMKTNYPFIKMQNKNKNDLNSNQAPNREKLWFLYAGLYIVIYENKPKENEEYENYDTNKYSFHYIDYYELAKVLFRNRGKDYKIIEN